MKGQNEITMAEPIFDSAMLPGAAETPGSDIDYVKIALRYKWLVLVATVLGLAVGQLGYTKMGPSYEASGRILVSKKVAIQIRDNAHDNSFGERAEHIALIMSPMIVGKAITAHKLNELPSLRGSKTPVDDILDSLRVQRSAGQDRSFLNVLDISYRNPNKRDAAVVVTAVIDAYRSYLTDSQAEHSQEVVTLISEANTNLLKQWREKQAEYLKFRDSAPLIWKTPPGAATLPSDVTNVHQGRQEAVEGDRRANLLKAAEVKSKLKALEQAIQSGQSRESLEALVRIFLTTSGKPAGAAVTSPGSASIAAATAEMEARILPLLLEEKKLLRDFGADHPDVEHVRKSIAMIYDFYRQRGVTPENTRAMANAGLAASKSKIDLVAVYKQSLEQQLIQLELRDIELLALAEQESTLAKQFAHYQAKDHAYNDEIAQIKSLWDAVVQRLNKVKMVKEDGGYTLKQIAPVRSALVMKRYLKFLGAGVFMGLAIAAGIIYLREYTDTTIKSLEEIRRRLALPVLGGVPEFVKHKVAADDNSGLLPALCYYHRPGSAEAEAYRAVRTTLFVGAGSDRHHVLQVTSPEPGDGKTTFVSNLAMAIAQSGKRVLLIDADMRRPTVHKLFGTKQEIGMSDVLAGEIEFANAVQPAAFEGLSLLTAGLTPANPAEMLSSTRFERLLTTAKAEYDFVLVDTPPLLAVSDPCIVGPKTDGLLLVLRMAKNKRAIAKRAAEMLAAHNINVIGIVANAIQHATEDAYAYGYGNRAYTDYLRPNDGPLPAPRGSADIADPTAAV